MRATIQLTITAMVMLTVILLGACAPAQPTAAPTKPSAPAAPTAAPQAQPTLQPTSVSTAAASTPTAAPKPAAKIKRGGVVRVAVQSDWSGFDPHTSLGDATTPGINALYDLLLGYEMRNGQFTIVPELASSWEYTDEGRQVVFHLRKDVKFQDGTAFDAEVAKWNLDRMMTHPKRRTKDITQAIKEVTVKDPSTLVVTLKQPSASFLAQLTDTAQNIAAMISKTAAEKWGDDFGKSPESTVGSGPFKLTEWVTGDHITLSKFDGYWDKGEDGKPLPYIDGIQARFISDVNVRFLELKAGNLDLTDRIAPKDVPGARSDPNLVLHEVPWNDYGKRMGFVPKVEPFDNKQVRQAVSYGLDRQAIATTLGMGIGKPEYFIFSSANVGYNKSLPHYDYQPEKVKQLLGDAGYPNGIDMVMTQIDRPEDRQLGEIMQAMLKKVNINVRIDVMERLAHNAARGAGKIGFFTAGLTRFPDAIMFGTWVTTNGSRNNQFYSNPELDKCFDEADRTLDQTKRQPVLERCQKIMFDDAQYVPIWSEQRFDASGKSLHGYVDSWNRPRWKWLWLDK
ncbi:MAG: ABC transporter substrate-binding protein [Chloroflexi bacterium]|nr:ABC transporter substrate-binding protein [Chloroflexota bacterium]